MIKFRSRIWLSGTNWILITLFIGLIFSEKSIAILFLLVVMVLIYFECRRKANDIYIYKDKIIIRNFITKKRYKYKFDDIVMIYFYGLRERSLVVLTMKKRKAFAFSFLWSEKRRFYKTLEETGLEIKYTPPT